jgi:hypothetical protein
MSKLAIAFFALAFVTVSASSEASSQTPAGARCNLTDATAPAVRGLKLGMSTEQLLALFPGATKRKEIKDALDRAKKAGSASEPEYLGFDPVNDGNAQQFAGVDSVSAGVYKGRVVDFSVQYGGATWRVIDEWIAKLSETFKLPGPQEWVAGPEESPNKVLKCDRVLIDAAIQGGSASLRLRNVDALKEIQEHISAMEEKKRRDSKP